MTASKQWAAFIRIPDAKTSDAAPALDEGWLLAKGVSPLSAPVLRLLKQHVVPLIDRLDTFPDFLEYHFLVHDRDSGVPAPAGDTAAYIHLRLSFTRPRELVLDTPFCLVHPLPDDTTLSVVGGVDYTLIHVDGSEGGGTLGDKTAWLDMILHHQSDLVLEILRGHEWDDDADMVRQVRQIMHWLANMTQMRVE